MSACLGLDTSNYSTSAALFGGKGYGNFGKPLPVPEGALGLRQSDALFLHTKALPEVLEQLFREKGREGIAAVGASTRPRRTEGSYMPCFLAGEAMGRGIALSLGVPFFAFSHQEGHIAAAAFTAGRQELMEGQFLAWHLSGGTTELLLAGQGQEGAQALRIGGTDDLAAGQLIDRTGKLLGLSFPAGREMDAMAGMSDKDICFTPKLRGLDFSLSGLENKARELYETGRTPEDTARFAILSVAAAVKEATEEALLRYPGLPVLFSGGVASSRALRKKLANLPGAIFAPAEYSGDNALGVAVLTCRALRRA